MSESYVPMPDTCHPHYARQADGIRALITGRSSIAVYEPQGSLVASFDEPKPIQAIAGGPRLLTVKQVAGGAPFVGDPRTVDGHYVWYAAVDDLGRHVACSASLEMHPRTARP